MQDTRKQYAYETGLPVLYLLHGALAGSDNDLLELYSRCKDNGLAPELYQACGTEDFLYANNRRIKNQMELLGYVYPGRFGLDAYVIFNAENLFTYI